MKKQEIDKKIELSPRWNIKMDLNYLNPKGIINLIRYNYWIKNKPILEIGENLLIFLERFISIDWTKYCDVHKEYCDVHKDWKIKSLSFVNDISLASDEFLSNNKDMIDDIGFLRLEAEEILRLIDHFLDEYNSICTRTKDYLRRDDLNFLAQFLLRLATRLENLEEIKTDKKPKN
jgi:hypothetical protein